MKLEKPPQFLTASEVGTLLGLSRSRIWQMTKDGELPSIPTKAANLYRLEDLRLFVEAEARCQREFKNLVAETGIRLTGEPGLSVSLPDLPITMPDKVFYAKAFEFIQAKHAAKKAAKQRK